VKEGGTKQEREERRGEGATEEGRDRGRKRSGNPATDQICERMVLNAAI